MTDNPTNGSTDIATDNDVAKSIAALDRACDKGVSHEAVALVRDLGSALSIPPCGTGARIVEAFMSVTRAVARFKDVDDLATWIRTADSLPLEKPSDQLSLGEKLKLLGEGYLNSGKLARAELLLAAALRVRQQSGPVDERSIKLATSIIETGAKNGNIDIGIEALQTELSRARKIDGSSIEFKLELLTHLLFYLPQIGRAEDAIPLGLELLDYRAEQVGKNLNEFLNALLGMVLSYISAEKFNDAAYVVRTRSSNIAPRLNVEDRDRLLRLPVAIANTLEQKNQLQEAEQFLFALIEQCRSKQEHPVVTHMVALHTLADMYERHVSEEDARPLREELQELQNEITKVSRSDPQIGANFLQEGAQLREKGLHDRAIECFEGAVRVFSETDGEASWNTVTSLTFLGSTQFRNGNLELAKQTLARCIKLIEACTEKEIPQLRLNLVYAFSEIGDSTQVELLARQVLLEISESDESAAEIKLSVENQLADALHALGRFGEALEFRRSVVEAAESVHGDSSSLLGYMLGNLALTLDALGERKQARESYDRSFELIHNIRLGA